jgi:LPXTG-motif cell wall-anchored protein
LDSTLFLDVDDCFGGGGAGFSFWVTTTLATCGGGFSTNLVSNAGSFPFTPNTGSADIYLPVANSGGGAGTLIDFDTVAAWDTTANVTGADGFVALRFSVTDVTASDVPASDLPATGENSTTAVISAGVSAGLLAVGAGALAIARRARRS